MNRQRAKELLGIERAKCTLTHDIVMEAFRRAVRINHPDTASIVMGTFATISDLTDAKDFLLENLDGSADSSCKLCQGLGMVRAKIGWLRCAACKGTGEKR